MIIRILPYLLTLTTLGSALTGCADRSDPPPPPQSEAAEGPVGTAPDLSTVGHELGSVMAAVTVIEFSDFGCPHCARFAQEVFPTLREEFVDTGEVRWVYLPVQMGFPNGEAAARTAQCAADQGKFWPMHDLLYERQAEWRGSDPAASDPLFLEYARSVSLDEAEFLTCYREDHPRQLTEIRRAIAAQVGVQGTPSFIVGDQFVEGTLPVERFRALLRTQLERPPA